MNQYLANETQIDNNQLINYLDSVKELIQKQLLTTAVYKVVLINQKQPLADVLQNRCS